MSQLSRVKIRNSLELIRLLANLLVWDDESIVKGLGRQFPVKSRSPPPPQMFAGKDYVTMFAYERKGGIFRGSHAVDPS